MQDAAAAAAADLRTARGARAATAQLRRLSGALAPALLAATLAAAPATAKPARYFKIPPAAFSHALGEFPATAACPAGLEGLEKGNLTTGGKECPAGDTGTQPVAYNQPAAQPGLGVPLGGVGSGSFMINQAGSFGPWDFGGATENEQGPQTQYEDRILPQAALHVREQPAGSSTATTRTLAVNAAPWNQLPSAWNTLQPGEGEYSALWPFGWETFKPFDAGVSVRFWSPIVAGNDELTSMPVAYFDVRLANTTKTSEKLSVMFTMPNAPEHENKGTVREGLSSQVQTDAGSGVTGVTLSASSPHNTADAQDSDWTIAAKPAPGQTVSYTQSWNAEGDGSDVYNAFSASGELPNSPLDNSSSAGAIAVTVTLAPKQETTIPFALAWDFPQTTAPPPYWDQSSSTYWMRRYTSFFGARETATNDYIAGSYPFHQGFAIADKMLREHETALSKVEGWWKKIVKQKAYPPWLVRETLNEEIQAVFNESFWESGLVSDTPSQAARVGAGIPDTHLFCTSTGGNWNDCNEWDIDGWGYLAEMLLWPDLERDRLRGCVQEVLENLTSGVCDAESALEGATGEQQENVGRLQFADTPMKTIYRMYAYYRRTGDAAFLKYAYPAMLKELRIVQKNVLPATHLPFDLPGQANSYDIWHYEGDNIYNSELYLLSEEIMIDATKKAHELGVQAATPEQQRQLAADLPQAKEEFETLFWEPLVHHYKIDSVGNIDYLDGIFIDTFFAQNIAATLGLPSLVNPVHEEEDLLTAYPQEMQEQIDGHLVGPPALVPTAGPLNAVTMEQGLEEKEVNVGPALMRASTYLQLGQSRRNPLLTTEGTEIAHALEYWLSEDEQLGFLFENPEAYVWNDPREYRSPSDDRSRAAIDVMNTIKPLVKWAVPPPDDSLYTTP